MADGSTARMAPAYTQAPPSSSRRQFGALDPETLTGVMRELERGELERWADLCLWTLTDPHVRSVLRTLVDGIVWAPVDVEPNPADEPSLAEAAVAQTEALLARADAWPDRYADLVWGGLVGVAVAELRWRPSRNLVDVSLVPVQTRDVRYRRWDAPEVRTYDRDPGGAPTGGSKWLTMRDYPAKFLVHAPRNVPELATMAGEMRAIVWPFAFKRWIEKFGLEGFGRMANGLLYMLVNRNAEKTTRTSHLDDLEKLAADGAVVIDHDPNISEPIRLLEMARDPGASAVALAQYYNGEISKAILGSGLNVEVQSTGGNRSLGESQFDTTTLPRLRAHAARALATLRRDVLVPYLRFNAHLFGGKVPQPPLLTARLVEPAVEVDRDAIDAGAVTIDEVRESRGLPPRGAAAGGEEIARIEVAPWGAPTGSPFSVRYNAPMSEAEMGRKVRPSLRRTHPTYSQTRLPLPGPLAHALSRRSGDPER